MKEGNLLLFFHTYEQTVNYETVSELLSHKKSHHSYDITIRILSRDYHNSLTTIFRKEPFSFPDQL